MTIKKDYIYRDLAQGFSVHLDRVGALVHKPFGSIEDLPVLNDDSYPDHYRGLVDVLDSCRGSINRFVFDELDVFPVALADSVFGLTSQFSDVYLPSWFFVFIDGHWLFISTEGYDYPRYVARLS